MDGGLKDNRQYAIDNRQIANNAKRLTIFKPCQLFIAICLLFLSASTCLTTLAYYEQRTLYQRATTKYFTMNRMIKITMLLVLVTMATFSAVAQSKMTEEQKQEAKAKYQADKEKLNLTEDQSKKVDAINTTWFEGITELKNSGASKMAKYKKLKSLNGERDKKMKEVLTKEQFKIYKEQQAERKDEFKQRRANRE
jgi:hypothetical protein